MTVDFSLLRPLKEVPNESPSRFVWAIVFFVLMLVGIVAVLMLWPAGRSTQTPRFWFYLALFPIGTAALVVLRRYSVYLGHRQDAIDDNNLSEQHAMRIFDIASRPLGVLASAYRYSTDKKENDVDQLLSETLSLETQLPPAPDAAPMKARWLAPLIKEQKVKPANDEERQAPLTEWLFNQLLSDVADTIRALPSSLRLTVHLNLCGSAIPVDAPEKWQRCWREHKLPDSVTIKAAVTTDLMMLDTWLDTANEPEGQEVRLLVFVQLNNLLKKVPPAGGAEAGVALLLVPVALAKQHRLPVIAQIHRPMQGRFDAIAHVLEYALKWGKSNLAEVARVWQAGMDVDRSGLLTASMLKAEVQVPFNDLDNSIGKAGSAAPWLGLACAVAALKAESGVQLMAHGEQDNLQLACCCSVAKK
ncbi:hypothetical protein [Collimonas antrihumi]|uniref:hypothetical protein n=1 Tax=Collimonas antrihumi TaxID=1940615 RepID=UPI001B8C0AE7|nr:hypothetical protein [Collimonas antrihumi]